MDILPASRDKLKLSQRSIKWLRNYRDEFIEQFKLPDVRLQYLYQIGTFGGDFLESNAILGEERVPYDQAFDIYKTRVLMCLANPANLSVLMQWPLHAMSLTHLISNQTYYSWDDWKDLTNDGHSQPDEWFVVWKNKKEFKYHKKRTSDYDYGIDLDTEIINIYGDEHGNWGRFQNYLNTFYMEDLNTWKIDQDNIIHGTMWYMRTTGYVVKPKEAWEDRNKIEEFWIAGFFIHSTIEEDRLTSNYRTD